MNETPSINRKALYGEVWTTPMVRLARKYGLSDVGLAKLCRRHGIPRPPMGYWARRRFGVQEPQPDLPPAESPDLEEVRLAPVSGGSDAPAQHAVDGDIQRRIVEELAAPPIVVADSLRDPHPLVAAGIMEAQDRAAEERRRRRDPNWYRTYREPEPRSRANVAACGKATLARAYRIMDALLKALEIRGYRIAGIPETRRARTLVSILEETFDLRIYEPSNQRPHILTAEEERSKARHGFAFHAKHDLVPTGRLCLQLRDEGAWLALVQVQDGKKQTLEQRLKDVIIAALKRVDFERQRAKERERQTAIHGEAERRRMASGASVQAQHHRGATGLQVGVRRLTLRILPVDTRRKVPTIRRSPRTRYAE